MFMLFLANANFLHKNLLDCFLSFAFFYTFLFISLLVISECAHQTFTFDGRCYNTCPERTFIVPEKISAGEVGSKGLSPKKRDANFYEFGSLQDIIGRTESLVKNRAIAGSVQKLCGSCHESCIRCNGPLETDCVICDSDYNQIIIGSKISCGRKANVTTWSLLDNLHNELNGYSAMEIIFISFVIVASMALMCISICLLFRTHDADNTTTSERDKSFSGKYSYNPIVQDNEEILLIKTQNISNVLSDDESDDSET